MMLRKRVGKKSNRQNRRARAGLPARVEGLEPRQLLSGNWSGQDQQIHLDQARNNYPNVTGAGQTVAIIDQGTDYNNPDLAGVVTTMWNFDTNSYDVMPYDNNAHGTGTAGQIAAQPHTYNGQLYEGIAPGAKIIALKANGTTETKAALDWIINNRTKYNIVAVNYLDISGSVNESVTLPEMQALNNAGVFMAGAVGNYGPGPAYGHINHLIYTVGSVNSANQLSGITPRGPALDFVAPGENVVISWYWNGQHMDYPSSGTSWAGPQVTGAAALIKQISPSFTPAQIASIIHDSATWVYDGYSNASYPELNVNGAMALAYQRAGKSGFSGPAPAPPPTPTPTPTPKPTPAPAPAPTANPTPFLRRPFAAGAVIEAENYDNGGEGVAYHDTTAQDEGNASSYRTGGVDIGRTRSRGGIVYVGWTHAGEWMDYSIVVPTSGTYALNTELAAVGSDASFHFEIDGRNVSGAVAVPDTGAWNAFSKVTVNGVSLSAGAHILRVVMDTNNSNGFVANFDSFSFMQSNAKAGIVTAIARAATAKVDPPSAPTNLVFSAKSSTTGLLNWIDTSNDETSFVVERATSRNGEYTVLDTIDATSSTGRRTGTRSYDVTGLKPGKIFFYKVVAVGTGGETASVAAKGATSNS